MDKTLEVIVPDKGGWTDHFPYALRAARQIIEESEHAGSTFSLIAMGIYRTALELQLAQHADVSKVTGDYDALTFYRFIVDTDGTQDGTDK